MLPGRAHALDGGRDVRERVRPLELLHVRAALLDLRILERDASLDAVEHGGRDRLEPFGRELICHALDVIRDAEDLLHDDDGARRFTLRLREIRIELVPVRRCQAHHLSHSLYLPCKRLVNGSAMRAGSLARRGNDGGRVSALPGPP